MYIRCNYSKLLSNYRSELSPICEFVKTNRNDADAKIVCTCGKVVTGKTKFKVHIKQLCHIVECNALRLRDGCTVVQRLSIKNIIPPELHTVFEFWEKNFGNRSAEIVCECNRTISGASNFYLHILSKYHAQQYKQMLELKGYKSDVDLSHFKRKLRRHDEKKSEKKRKFNPETIENQENNVKEVSFDNKFIEKELDTEEFYQFLDLDCIELPRLSTEEIDYFLSQCEFNSNEPFPQLTNEEIESYLARLEQEIQEFGEEQW